MPDFNSAHELLDIVDHEDRVVGQATRGEIHRLGHRHRATHMVLSNSAGQVFVQKRSPHKDTHPGLWDSSAAGHVDAGEAYLDCAVRELEEELGIRVSRADCQEVARMAPSERNGHEFVRIYRICSDETLTLEATEISDGRWLGPDELDAWIAKTPEALTPSFIEIWQLIRSTCP